MKYTSGIVTLLILATFGQTGFAQGQMWGVTSHGGVNNTGVIFKMNLNDQSYTVQKSIVGDSPGYGPVDGKIIQATNGKLYGLTFLGGEKGYGVLYEYDPSTKVYLKKIDFDGVNGGNPFGSLFQASNGKIYGITRFGGTEHNGASFSGKGVLFEYDPATGISSKKFDFTSASGYNPIGIIEAANGKFYGTSSNGGANNVGTLFEYNPLSGALTNLFDFDFASSGGSTTSALVQAANGKLYGLTLFNGGLFEYNLTTNVFVKKFSFDDGVNKGDFPNSLMKDPNGKLYGLTSSGGANGTGVIFEYDLANDNFVKRFDFETGVYNTGGLILGSNGKFYGQTSNGGPTEVGTLFEFDPSNGAYQKRLDFDAATIGSYPSGTMFSTADGTLFGTTNSGGSFGAGTLFQFNYSTGIVSKEFEFFAEKGGASPTGKLTMASSGKLYGAAGGGGKYNLGVLYEYDPSTGNYVKKVDFSGEATGSYPAGSMVLTSNGKLYGITYLGGSQNMGVLFEYDPITSIFAKKFDFSTSMGSNPRVGLVLAANGKIYGSTNSGGINNGGVLFEYDPSTSNYLKRFDLSSSANGGMLTHVGANIIYGVTPGGGANGIGSIFEFNVTSGAYLEKFSFDFFNTGYRPNGSLTKALNGKLYGCALFGTTSQQGMIYEFDPTNGNFAKKIDFPATPGFAPVEGNLELSPNGKLYGTTAVGGANDRGIFFEYDPVSNGFVKRLDFAGLNGSNPDMSNLTFVKDNQIITFGPLQSKTIGDGPFDVLATSDSPLPILFTSSDPTVASITGNTVTILKVGTTTITATQQENDYYKQASVGQVLFVKGNQQITFTPLSSRTFGDPSFVLAATSNSLLPMNYVSSNVSVATISGSTVTIVGAGTSIITASQPGNTAFNPAADVTQSLTVVKAPQTIAFAALLTKTLGDSPFALVATATSTLPISFTTTSDKATISGSLVTLVKAGSVTITASQAGNSNYNPGTPIDQKFCINPIKPIVSVNSATSTLTSNAALGNQWFLNNSAIAGATGQVLTVTQTGVYKVQVRVDDCVSEFSADQSLVVAGDTEDHPKHSIEVYPNPVRDWLTVSFGSIEGKKTVVIVKLDGKVQDSKETFGQEMKFDVSDYPRGIYVAKVLIGKSVTMRRFLKQ